MEPCLDKLYTKPDITEACIPETDSGAGVATGTVFPADDIMKLYGDSLLKTSSSQENRAG